MRLIENASDNRTRYILNTLVIFSVISVIILAVFVIVLLCEPKYTRLEVATPPTNTQYIEGEILDTKGLVVKAYYGKDSVVITSYSVDKTVLQLGDENVTVSFTDSGITKTASFGITVSQRNVESIEIVSMPHKTEYLEGETFDTSGMVVQANFDNGEFSLIADYDYDLKRALQVTDKKVTVTYGEQSAFVDIIVKPKILSKILASCLPQKLSYKEGEYFDFLGLEVYAIFENADTEVVKDWNYDKKEPLKTTDTNVEISYTLNNITKSFTIAITVSKRQEVDADIERINELINLLPDFDKMTVKHLSSIEYVISAMNSTISLTAEQIEYKEKLVQEQQKILDSMPVIPEPEFSISYAIANELDFADIDYGSNPLVYKASDGSVQLGEASSVIAYEQGYEFRGWLIDSKESTHLNNISSDTIVYASFVMSNNAKLVFKKYDNQEDLLNLTVARSDNYDFDANGITSTIYSTKGIFPIAFFSQDNERLSTIDLSSGRTIIVNTVVAEARELHLANSTSANVSWIYDFSVNLVDYKTEQNPSMGTVFVVPVGANVTITSIDANISSIKLDGIPSSERFNSYTVIAKFVLIASEYAVSVTFDTVLADTTTISFWGFNSHSVTYPSGWNGYIDSTELNNIEFIYGENNEQYLVTYTIDGKVYYFEDLAQYQFNSSTQIIVNRVRNSFSVTVHYANGTEKIEGIKGRQSLKAALDTLDASALEVLNAIFEDDRLYTDSNKIDLIPKDTLLAGLLRSNIVLYSPWSRTIEVPIPPDYGEVDYKEHSFVNTWGSQFVLDADILYSEINLLSDGTYTYKTTVNGIVSANVSGIYRLVDGVITVKTIESDVDALITVDDIKIDIAFVADGLMMASFIDLRGTTKVTFNHTLTCGEVKIVNYTDKQFIGAHKYNGVDILLRGNGTAILSNGENEVFVYYRVTQSNNVYIFSNGLFTTGIINDLIGDINNAH